MPSPLSIRLKTIHFLDYLKNIKLIKPVLKHLKKEAPPSIKKKTTSTALEATFALE